MNPVSELDLLVNNKPVISLHLAFNALADLQFCHKLDEYLLTAYFSCTGIHVRHYEHNLSLKKTHKSCHQEKGRGTLALWSHLLPSALCLFQSEFLLQILMLRLWI